MESICIFLIGLFPICFKNFKTLNIFLTINFVINKYKGCFFNRMYKKKLKTESILVINFDCFVFGNEQIKI
jgi:hypothetical protein